MRFGIKILRFKMATPLALSTLLMTSGCTMSINHAVEMISLPSENGTVPQEPVALNLVPPAPLGKNEPVFNSNMQVLLFRDDFDYLTFADANANGWRGTDGSNGVGYEVYFGPPWLEPDHRARLRWDGSRHAVEVFWG